MDNSLMPKGEYTAHRRLSHPSLIPLDNTNLTLLLAEPNREQSCVNCKGWKTIDGVVLFTGGTHVTLQPLELIRYTDASGVAQKKFVQRGSLIGPLVDGGSFSVTVNEGLFFLRFHNHSGSQTSITILLSGGERAEIGRT